ncbi:MAG TPA: OmpA family protein [Acetobacteraceae bacterium]|nr:OmpA family protein [Acetobacteraceae bacterium]
MTIAFKRYLIVGSLFSAVALAGCGVSQSDYDALKTQNQQLQQQLDAQSKELADAKAQITRLQGAIKYTVNSDLLFPSGSWHMSAAGKRIIARLAQKLASTQQNKLVVNGYTDNTPVGPGLQRQGITSNDILSQKRAEDVMQYMISQGVKSDLISAHGYGDADPVASNDTPKGRAQNRRVEITLAPEGS